jgi:hypothetical protein
MKLLWSLFAFSLAQENEDSSVESDYDDLGNKKKGNKNNYSDNSPYGGSNSYGSAYGDPHFMIKNEDQPPICFDFNPPSGATLNLLIDPVSALAVTAETGENEKGLNFMTKVHFMSPDGARLLFDVDGVHLDGLGEETASDPHPITGHQVYGDLIFVEKLSFDGIHDHTKIQVGEDGPEFIIKGNINKKNLSVMVSDSTGISPKCRGLIGQFMRPNSYRLRNFGVNEAGENTALVVSGGARVAAVEGPYHHADDCFVIAEDDILHVMANL